MTLVIVPDSARPDTMQAMAKKVHKWLEEMPREDFERIDKKTDELQGLSFQAGCIISLDLDWNPMEHGDEARFNVDFPCMTEAEARKLMMVGRELESQRDKRSMAIIAARRANEKGRD